VDRIRIALVDLPRALRDVAGSWLASEEDIEVVEGPERADVLMVAAPESDHARLCAELIERHPHVRVLILDPGSGKASTCRLEPRRSELGVLPLARLSDVVRSAMRPTRVD
jgi:hypothetical protein